MLDSDPERPVLLHRAEALVEGYTDAELARMVRRKELSRLQRGAYTEGSALPQMARCPGMLWSCAQRWPGSGRRPSSATNPPRRCTSCRCGVCDSVASTSSGHHRPAAQVARDSTSTWRRCPTIMWSTSTGSWRPT